MVELLLAALLALQPVAEPPMPQVSVAPPATAVETIPPTPAEVMAIPPELRELVHQRVRNASNSRKIRLDRLATLLFDQDGLGMQYVEDATYTVAEAYRTRKANCLTFTLLTIALAREAGLQAYPQEIERTLSWNSAGENIFVQNMHVNAGLHIDGRQFTIDVASSELLTHSPPRRVADARLLSLYYNNRAMELVLQERPAEARIWLTLALDIDDRHATPWNNAGVLAMRERDLSTAELHFLKALQLNPGHAGALANIVSHYQRLGNEAHAAKWRRQAERVLHSDPLQQFLLGRRAEQQLDLMEAVKRYKRAIRLDKRQHLFHSAIARVWLQLGEPERAREALMAAAELDADSDRYQAKLDKLHRLGH